MVEGKGAVEEALADRGGGNVDDAQDARCLDAAGSFGVLDEEACTEGGEGLDFDEAVGLGV